MGLGKSLDSIWTRMAQRLASIGVIEADDDQDRLEKTLLVASSAMISLASVIWGAIYLALDRADSDATNHVRLTV